MDLPDYKQFQILSKLLDKFGQPERLDDLFIIFKHSIQQQVTDDNKLLGLAWTLKYYEKVSNSHCCPVNGTRNWAGNDDRPKHYPGYSGRFWLRLKKPSRTTCLSYSSDLVKATLGYCGTGGAGAYDGPWSKVDAALYTAPLHVAHRMKREGQLPESICYSWDFKIFSDDYPLIKDTYIKERLLNIIKTNKSIIDIKSTSEWTDAEQEAIDKRFIAITEEEMAT